MGRAAVCWRLAAALVLTLLWPLVAVPIPAGAATDPLPGRVGVDELRSRVAAEVGRRVGTSTPGAVVAVVDRDGPLVLQAWGLADPVREIPLSTRSRTPVASVSKVVTALTALTMDGRGELDLDSEVAQLTGVALRDLRQPADRQPVTGRHLLTHRSGIEEPVVVHPDPPRTAADIAPLLGPWLSAHPPVLRYPPGFGVHYSALQGYALLGAAIERSAGRPFDEVARTNVLGPVGAGSAGFPAGFDPTGTGDVVMADRSGPGWVAAPWPPVHERPAGGLVWSAEDAAALLSALVRDDGTLPHDVVAEAMRTSVRPPQGSGGHTGVFFEQWRQGLRSLEHPGGNGVAWLAVLPDAGVGVFAAVTTEGSEAASLPPAIVELTAKWAAETGRAPAQPEPAAGRPTIDPPGDVGRAQAVPVGTFQGRVFEGHGAERSWRMLATEMSVAADGPDLVIGGRRFGPAAPGRWCDTGGCIAGLRAPSGTLMLLRSDGGMMEQVMVEVPWWSTRTAASAALGAGALLVGAFAALAVAARIRMASLRRRARDPAAPPAAAHLRLDGARAGTRGRDPDRARCSAGRREQRLGGRGRVGDVGAARRVRRRSRAGRGRRRRGGGALAADVPVAAGRAGGRGARGGVGAGRARPVDLLKPRNRRRSPTAPFGRAGNRLSCRHP